MNFIISPSVFSLYPNLTVGVIHATGIDNTRSSPDIAEKLREVEAHARSTMNAETFKEHPHLAALQEAHRAFGNNPNKFPPSIQALIKRVLKGGELPSINPLVDLYNVISLKYIVPAGGEDLDATNGDIRLTIADGTELFTPLGETTNDPPQPGEAVYRDDTHIICRKMNWREGDKTKLTDHTKNAVLVIEGLPPVSAETVSAALAELADLVAQYCNALSTVYILTKQTPFCDLPSS